jgi:hypothetical protein
MDFAAAAGCVAEFSMIQAARHLLSFRGAKPSCARLSEKVISAHGGPTSLRRLFQRCRRIRVVAQRGIWGAPAIPELEADSGLLGQVCRLSLLAIS